MKQLKNKLLDAFIPNIIITKLFLLSSFFEEYIENSYSLPS